MKIQRKLLVRLIITVTAIMLLGVLCIASEPITYSMFLEGVDSEPNGGDFHPEDYYKIDTNTIIPSLDQGKTDVFTFTTAAPEKFWPDNANYFQWYQSDFSKIAAALNQFAGGDKISDWNILKATFNSVCEANSNGFSTGYFVLFRSIWVENRLYYEAREIFVDPLVDIVRWGEGRIYPRPLFGWNEIKLDKFRITAEQALMIAEENGGKQARLDNGNNCGISVIGKEDYWLVLYSEFVARFHIDAYTGEVTDVRD